MYLPEKCSRWDGFSCQDISFNTTQIFSNSDISKLFMQILGLSGRKTKNKRRKRIMVLETQIEYEHFLLYAQALCIFHMWCIVLPGNASYDVSRCSAKTKQHITSYGLIYKNFIKFGGFHILHICRY